MTRKVIIAGVNTGETQQKFRSSMDELASLAEACELEVAAEMTQNLSHINKATYIGPGKAEELKNLIEETDAVSVIFDDELSPSQIRNLEKQLDCEVIDRTMLILDIFAGRAKTKEAQLQVEVARLKYMMPRLVGMREDLGRQGGGSGLKNRGAGETKLELDRRKIEEKISKLSKELEQLTAQRKTQRKLRNKNGVPVVALVGYTNAGKSTVMNAMLEKFGQNAEKQVFEKDMLFATLETSVRRMDLANNRSFLLTDTVGFIDKLPHHLVKAFRSTLEEVKEADLLVHVLDVSNPDHEEHRKLTDKVLTEIGVRDIPVIYAYNKVDLTDGYQVNRVKDRVYLSAKKRAGLDELTTSITNEIFNDYEQCTLLIPYTEGEIVSYFNEYSEVLNVEYEQDGTKLKVVCKRADFEKYKQYIVREEYVMSMHDEHVLQLAEKNGVALKPGTLKRNESGLDFLAVFAEDVSGEKWLLRIPRREDVLPTAKKEKEILDIVHAAKLPFQSPKWEIFTDELIAYKLLDGVPAGTIDMEAKAYVWEIDEKNIPDAYYKTQAAAMVALHGISHSTADKAGLAVKTPEQLRTSMQERMDNIREVYGVSEKLWERWKKWLADDDLWPKQTAFIHGDLHPGHILVDEHARVTGFIDWTEAHVGDAATDFTSHLAAFGEDELKKLLTAYEHAGGYMYPRMFEHIVELFGAYPVGIAEFALKSGLAEYEEMAKAALGVAAPAGDAENE